MNCEKKIVTNLQFRAEIDNSLGLLVHYNVIKQSCLNNLLLS